MAQTNQITFEGRGWRLFWLALSRMCLTIVTLGLARFWMITRLRRYYWSSVTIAGTPLEYTGRAGEKFIGFLIAVVILALYLAAVNLLLTFVGLAFFQGNPAALNLSILAAVPLGFWAQYRARRYILARTRWRGIRFGATSAAWGYTATAMWWWTVTIISLGLLYPWMQLALSRYVTNRSWFGDAQFSQAGRLWPLMRAWLWVWVPVIALSLGVMTTFEDTAALINSVENNLEAPSSTDEWGGAGLVWLPIGVFAVIGALYLRYQVIAFRYLNSQKTVGAAGFGFELPFWTVFRIYVVGYILVIIVLTAVAMALFGAAFLYAYAIGADMSGFEAMTEGQLPVAGAMVTAIIFAALYLFLIALYTALRHTWITRPLARAVVASTTILNIAALNDVRQRAHDEQAEAGGFADALGADPGAAF
ncbi:MAG: YjgN family protein [Pikeienuella sp.]